jgi:Ca2+-binding EF-hand superfamily protein
MNRVRGVAWLLWACSSCGTLFAQGVATEAKPIAFSTLDANHDGKISRSEARADPELSADFDMLDSNHDGYLSPEEFQAWPRALKTKSTAARDPATVPGGSAGAQHMPPN